MPHDVNLDDLPDRWISSEVDLATMWRDTVDMEDKLRIASWKKKGEVTPIIAKAVQPPPKPVRREDLLAFTSSQGDWKAALADADAAEAMRRVRTRVASLAAEARAVQTFAPVQPNAGATLLNAKEPAPRHMQFRTSSLNPMNADIIERGWDPRIRRWTGRHMNGAPQEPTSLWCSSWGACAGTKSVDTEFKHVRPQDIEAFHFDRIKEMGHTRSWR
uniref:Uncharacterized protein n=1 Tax=Haptolina brevifila TaxID=156173 RepID=A0A7S2MF72_9EUKA|mmetsp:Transcript_50971/g.101369  ORF Transcript_50971/g.101369 Transcript_50971/m.101369 type:complete len:217 (+) Transcript_50971:68-718(+)